MANLDIGCDFSREHVETIIELNTLDGAQHRITDVYGSPGALNPFGSVRLVRREYTPAETDFDYAVYLLSDAGITVNLTINSLHPRRVAIIGDSIFDSAFSRSRLIKFLDALPPARLIVSHPGMLDILRECYERPRSVIISTIMNVHRLSQLQYIKDRWPFVTKVCPALWKNRDFKWLKAANEIIPLELLANEFCSISGIECEGLYRQTCYMAQSLGIKNWNPMDVCIEERKKHPEAWLMARFILPQWLDLYKEKTGVQHFKITGRTHPASFIKDVGTKYVIGKAEGNLLSLWGQLEATMEGAGQVEVQKKMVTEHCVPIELAEAITERIHACSTGEDCGRECNFCRRLIEE